ncbi:MAG: restriction endonuclease subunit S [Calditrichaceae bacterium]|nr:restriction endonuclease subunit S [Calditrichaceae bacterium]MBN2707636.1 restriction endonuclease subunit S [Calditrichaceae bacterium]RQV93194.1 MAG: hypothetical protein EH224_12920 [Calditrichota bacterium]
MMKNNYPKTWYKVKLGDILKLNNGFAFKSKDYSTDGIPLVRISDIHNGLVNLDNVVYVSENKFEEDYIINKDDILIAMSGATTGKFGIYKNNITALQNQRVGNFKTNDKLIYKIFLYYYLFVLKNIIEKEAYGGAQPNISSRKIESQNIYLPPLPEQKRIVAKIEELFSEIDAGIETLKKAREQLKTYRQSVLKHAFEGKLNHDYGNSAWATSPLKEVCSKIQDGTHYSPKIQYNEKRPNTYMYITAKNIKNNYIDLSNVTWIGEEFHKKIYLRCNPEYGDILLTKDGVNTGDVTINTINEPISILSSLCLLKPDRTKIIPSYLKYYIQSPIGKRNILGKMTGTAIKRIILIRIKESTVLYPSIKIQNQIVQEIEARLSEADHMQETIEQSLKQAEALKQSILKKAFEGRLVPQDPNDEPAEKLLEKIKQEKANLNK